MRTILVHLTGSVDDEAVLSTASAIGGFVPHLQVTFVSPDPFAMIAPITAVDVAAYSMAAEAITAFEQDTASRKQSARKVFERFCEQHDISKTQTPVARLSAEWKEMSGDVTEVLINEARFCDATVVSGNPRADLRHLPADKLGHIIVAAGNPIVLSPPKGLRTTPSTIAIAWKNSREAARALTSAMPLLEAAKKVFVISAAENDAGIADSTSASVIRQLLWHGISATDHKISVDGKAAAEAILQDVKVMRADLLVMGGYGHSRMRELIFGGFTAHVLRGVDVPVFIVH